MPAWAVLLVTTILIAALLILGAGCSKMGDGSSPLSSATPIVRASDGASAALVIVACPPTEARAFAVGELIDVLTRHEELVTARTGGNARLLINACPHGVPPEVLTRRR